RFTYAELARRRLGAVAALFSLVAIAALTGCGKGAARASKANAVDGKPAVVDLGPLRPTETVTALLGIRRKVADQTAQLEALAQPGSAVFGRYLTPAALAAKYGADPAAVDRVRRQLA